MSKAEDTQANGQFAFTPENEKLFAETLTKYPTKMAVLLPALWIAQRQNGHLTDDVLEYVADRLELSPVHVYSVVEFYSMYHTQPVGTYHVQLCRTLSCVLCDGEKIQAHLEQKHGLKAGEVTHDGEFSLELVECLGSCGTAPVMRINEAYLENLTIAKVDQIIADCKAGKAPQEEPIKPY